MTFWQIGSTWPTSMRGAEDRCPPNHGIWHEHVHEHVSHQHANEVCHDYSQSDDELISLKETIGLCEGRAEQHYHIFVRAYRHTSVLVWWTVLWTLESRMNCADNNHVTGLWNTLFDASWYRVDSRFVTNDGLGMLLMFFSSLCFQLSGWSMTALLSVFVTYGHATGWLFFFRFSVSSFCCSSLSSHGWYMCTHGHLHISCHRPLKTSSHPAVHILVSPILTCCIVENPRKWCPVFHSLPPRSVGAIS